MNTKLAKFIEDKCNLSRTGARVLPRHNGVTITDITRWTQYQTDIIQTQYPTARICFQEADGS
eukprot:2283412-Rhodomonas_salina.1